MMDKTSSSKKRKTNALSAQRIWLNRIFSQIRKSFSNRVHCDPSTPPLSDGTLLSSGAQIKGLFSANKVASCRDAATQTWESTMSDCATQVDDTMFSCRDEPVSQDADQQASDKDLDSLSWHSEYAEEALKVCYGLKMHALENPPSRAGSQPFKRSSGQSGIPILSRTNTQERRVLNTKMGPTSLTHGSDKQVTAPTLRKKTEQKALEFEDRDSPERTLAQSLVLLTSKHWEENVMALNTIGSLAQRHPDVLEARLHDVCLSLILEVVNPRSSVSQVAMATIGTMYNHLQGNMDPELELTTTALLQKVTDRLFQKDVDAALESMVWNCTPTCTMKALLAGGQRHLSDAVRRCTAQHLASLVERVGPAHLLLDTKDTAELILPAVTRLAQDSSQATRHFGQQMLMCLASHAEFEEMVHKYVPAKGIPQLRTISHKPEFDKSQSSSSSVSKSKRALSGVGVTQGLTQQAKSHSIAEREKYIKAMQAQMGSNDFRMRLRAIDKIAADCAEKPDLVAACKFPIFDAIAARLQESNRKINQHTLEALQSMIPLLRDCLGQVLNILLPVIVENHLNSKIDDIHRAAVGALDSLIFHLDNTLLLDIMCNRAQVLGGKAKGHLIEKVADIVRGVYQRKPQMVEQTALPLLWKLLASSSYREHTTTLCKALYTHMGQRLRESAVNQPMTIISALNQMLRTF